MKTIQSGSVLIGMNHKELRHMIKVLTAFMGSDPNPPPKNMGRVQADQKENSLNARLIAEFKKTIKEEGNKEEVYYKPIRFKEGINGD